MKIVICASEVVPFAKTGGLADVAGALPLALEELGHEVIILMPFYKKAVGSKLKTKKVASGVCSTKLGESVNVYFIENNKYFNRQGLYGTKQGDYPDNLQRFSFYCKKSLELLKRINFQPDIIHVNDWQTCCIPIYLKTSLLDDPFFKNTKTLLTIHNLAYQGLFDAAEFPKLGLELSVFNIEGLEFYGKVNLLKGGIIFSDCVNTVSSTYASEIQTKEFGCGLDGVLTKRKNSLFGILNGLDYSIWNPSDDKLVVKQYDVDVLGDKYKNKQYLQQVAKLKANNGLPLFGMVSRLSEQKGLDILAEAMDQICKLDMQLVILGTGEERYHKLLKSKSKKYSDKFSLFLKFDNALAHNIYAGSDVFLMPSRYEPCGLGQMISLRYGSVPLAFMTGGLADTVNKENGFIFDSYGSSALVDSVKQALLLYKDKKKWQSKVAKGMKLRFSWQRSAKEYSKLYNKLLGIKIKN